MRYLSMASTGVNKEANGTAGLPFHIHAPLLVQLLSTGRPIRYGLTTACTCMHVRSSFCFWPSSRPANKLWLDLVFLFLPPTLLVYLKPPPQLCPGTSYMQCST